MQSVLTWIRNKKNTLSLIQIGNYLFVLLSLLLTVAIVTHPYWASDRFPYTHDGENHLARFANYKVALKEGQFPPRIGPNLHNRYGYPVFNFNYPLANILSVPFSMLKVSYEITFSLQVIFATILAWIGIWLTVKEHLKKTVTIPSLLASLYISAPYITTALFYRGNIGEIWAYALFPWLYLSCVWISKYNEYKQNSTKLLVTIVTVTIWISFLLAHNLAVVISIPLLIAVAVITFQNAIKAYIQAVVLGVVAVGSTLWFWLPALMEKQYITLSDVNLSKQFSTHFLHFDDLFIQAHRFGFSLDGFINSNTPSMGIPFLLVFIIFIGIILHQMYMYFIQIYSKTSRSIFNPTQAITLKDLSTSLLLVGIASFSLLMATDMSKLVWESNHQLMLIQFPWRWLLITPMALLLGLIYSIRSISKNSNAIETKISQFVFILLLPVVLTQLVAISRYTPADRFTKTNVDYDAFSMTTSTQNENFPKTFNYKNIADWQPTPTILTSDDEHSYEISVEAWNGTKRTYRVQNTEPVLVAEPTMYFPGWETKVISNEQTIKVDLDESIQKYDSELQGRIGFMLEPGSHTVTTTFTQNTWPRLVGNSISALSLIAIFLYTSNEIVKIYRSKLKNT